MAEGFEFDGRRVCMKVLNLYAGIGGNRDLWKDVDVTAVEIDPQIARIYQDRYPEDTVIVGDAHKYLIDHASEFDFIWTSPPCPSHSQYRQNVGVIGKGFAPLYPDMSLYQEIIFLQHNFKGDWAVENTVPYYEPLIPAQKVSRHMIWSNMTITPLDLSSTGIRDKNKIKDLEDFLGFDLSAYKIANKRQILRNCVRPELGAHILAHIEMGEQMEKIVTELVG